MSNKLDTYPHKKKPYILPESVVVFIIHFLYNCCTRFY